MTTLAQHLKRRSKAICRDSECAKALRKGGDHQCGESYAYIDRHGRLLDICASDYFAGSSENVAAIALPWRGSQRELMRQVRDDIGDMEEA